MLPKNKARRETGFSRNNPKIIAQNIFVATPNSKFARNHSFRSRTHCIQLENCIFSIKNTLREGPKAATRSRPNQPVLFVRPDQPVLFAEFICGVCARVGLGDSGSDDDVYEPAWDHDDAFGFAAVELTRDHGAFECCAVDGFFVCVGGYFDLVAAFAVDLNGEGQHRFLE